MGLWIPLVLFYGLAKGARDALKKQALTKSSVIEVLFYHALIALVVLIPFSHNLLAVSFVDHLWIFLKSFVIFVGWIFAFTSIKHMPVSLYGVIDTARVVFSIVLALIFLGEVMTIPKAAGLLLVILGIVLVNFGNKDDGKAIKMKYLVIALLSCLLNAISGLLDKMLLSKGTLDSSQLQFFYMLYMTALYGVYIIFKREKIKLSTIKNNYWIAILSVLFVIADRALFIANEDPESQITVMTLIKQSSVLVTVLCGKMFFKEKHILKRTVCAMVVFAGIILATVSISL